VSSTAFIHGLAIRARVTAVCAWWRRALLPAGIVLLAAAGPARGHAMFMTCVEHHAAITVRPENIDVAITLTFFEVRSLADR
jgi:hypothetical protein